MGRLNGNWRWALECMVQSVRPVADRPVHLILCITDHYEPRHGPSSREIGLRRVQAWSEEYPRLFERFRDADGRRPQHTFFYPLEEYERAEMGVLADLC